MDISIPQQTRTPKYGDTKVIVRLLREYDGHWFSGEDQVFFFEGKPPKSKIVDAICHLASQDKQLVIDAKFDIGDVTLQDYYKHNQQQ